MNLYEMQYCDDRIEDILRDLRKSNSKYSAYCQTDGELFARIKNILAKKEGGFIFQEALWYRSVVYNAGNSSSGIPDPRRGDKDRQ